MTFKEDAALAAARLDQYLADSGAGRERVIDQKPMAGIIETLNLEACIREGGLGGETLDRFVRDYLAHTTRLHHPGFFAHQVAPPAPLGSIGSLIDGATNNAMAIYEMGPAAAAIEHFMVNTILARIGWAPMPDQADRRLKTDHGGGVLTHGGSLANLTALLAARHALDPRVRNQGNPGDLTLMVPASSHYSVAKAAGIMGMGQAGLVHLPVDDLGRVVPDRLEQAWTEAVDKGKRVVAVVANACSTATGLYDPVDEMADFCREKGLWFHVDGAHGGCALFTPRHRDCLKGIGRADSMILDAHKMLRTPTVCAAVLVREARHLDMVFEETASYLFHEKVQPGFDFIQQTVECTKAGLGLRFFLSMAELGEKGLAAYIDATFDLALEAHGLISGQPDFTCACPPQSNILCFRFRGRDSNSRDKDQLAIRDRLIQEGKFYISSAEVGGKRWLRIVVLSPHSTLAHVEALLDSIRDIAGRL